jgi:hypothetical protein
MLGKIAFGGLNVLRNFADTPQDIHRRAVGDDQLFNRRVRIGDRNIALCESCAEFQAQVGKFGALIFDAAMRACATS